MSADAKLREAARMMAERLKLFRKDALQAKDRGETFFEVHVEGYWQTENQRALDAYEQTMNEITGARPLFEEAS